MENNYDNKKLIQPDRLNPESDEDMENNDEEEEYMKLIKQKIVNKIIPFEKKELKQFKQIPIVKKLNITMPIIIQKVSCRQFNPRLPIPVKQMRKEIIKSFTLVENEYPQL